MVAKAIKEAVLSVLSLLGLGRMTLKAAVPALLSHDRRARIETPAAAQLIGVSKRTLMDRISSGDWPLAVDYERLTRSFCYLAQVTAKHLGQDVPTIKELRVCPRRRPAALNFEKAGAVER